MREELRVKLDDALLYERYELLVSDKDLWGLMLVEFSPELAERTQQIAVAEKLTIEDKVQVELVSKDERRIREGIAAVLNKAPSQLTEPDDYERVTELDLSGTSIKNIELLAKLKNLQSLNLSETQVDISALSSLTNLQWLNLSGTPVVDISALSSLMNLQGLYLSRTPVVDISALSSLTSLQRLDLSGTQVVDISALSSLTNLQSLALSGTQVVYISTLSSLTNLQWLVLSGTKVSDEQVAEFKKALPELEILR